MKFLFKNRLATFGFVIIILMIVTAISAPIMAPHDPNKLNLEMAFGKSSLSNPLGLDQNGADLASKIIYGARVSLIVGFSTVLFSMLIGTTLGLLSGFYGGIVDQLLMRLVDIFMAFPGILLAMGIASLLPPSIYNVIFALSVTGWVGYARIVRGQTLSIKEHEHVIASKSLGASDFRIILLHILPNGFAPIIVTATFGMAGAILGEASLSFLGIGLPPTANSWGAMLDLGRQHLLNAPRLAIFPGIAIMLAVLGFNFLGDGLRDFFDPKTRE